VLLNREADKTFWHSLLEMVIKVACITTNTIIKSTVVYKLNKVEVKMPFRQCQIISLHSER